MSQDILLNLTFNFALRIVSLSKKIQESKKDFVLSKQLLRSGTAIGALIREAQFAQSRADFISKLSISLKEANETVYWIELISKSYESNDLNCHELLLECNRIKAMLINSVKNTKNNL